MGPSARGVKHSAFYLEGNWLAEGGGILPFRSDAEAISFLEAAEVVASEEIPGTSGKPLRLVLEKDGVQARAIFRTVNVERLWQNLQQLDPTRVRGRLGAYLKVTEIDALMARRDKLVELISKQIAKRGEQAILFEFVRS